MKDISEIQTDHTQSIYYTIYEVVFHIYNKETWNTLIILFIFSELNSPLGVRASQMTTRLTSTCLQTEVKGHTASLGMTCGQHIELFSLVKHSRLLQLQISNYPLFHNAGWSLTPTMTVNSSKTGIEPTPHVCFKPSQIQKKKLFADLAYVQKH